MISCPYRRVAACCARVDDGESGFERASALPLSSRRLQSFLSDLRQAASLAALRAICLPGASARTARRTRTRTRPGHRYECASVPACQRRTVPQRQCGGRSPDVPVCQPPAPGQCRGAEDEDPSICSMLQCERTLPCAGMHAGSAHAGRRTQDVVPERGCPLNALWAALA